MTGLIWSLSFVFLSIINGLIIGEADATQSKSIKDKKSKLLFSSALLLGAIFSTSILAMIEEERKTEEAREDSNPIVLPIDVWARVSGQLISKRDVVNFSRVCKFAHVAIGTDAAWEGIVN